jgi:hypothetical protein
VAPDLLRGLHLAGDLVGPLVRNVAIGQPALTPERFVKWIVPFSSSKTLAASHGSHAELSVFVYSSAVLNPPQKMTPATKPAEREKAKTEIGRRAQGRLDPTVAPEPAPCRVIPAAISASPAPAAVQAP